ncbi:MAG TPA: phenylalanine--tRNA ligase subunit beta, partial [Woeseiaceae bacterium]|nr:phenylalanine--tRNA ligase subunit beta [Woeseiaceae bacterium]
MKFSDSWLRAFVAPSATAEELAERLTMAGHEVDDIEIMGAKLDGILVTEVLAVKQHPDADRLSVCRVYDGDNEYEIVCGARNVAVGMKSILALPGATLPNGARLR